MLRKEVKELTNQSLVFLAILVVLPIIVLLGSSLLGFVLSFGELFFFLFHVGLVIFSVFMGTSLFSRDMADGGIEYLLTLPYTRLQLLAIKTVPRFLAVIAAFVLYMILLSISGITPNTANTVPLLDTASVFFLCISLFIIGVPFSITRGSIIISGLVTLFVFMVYLGIVYLIFPTALFLKGVDYYYLHSFFRTTGHVPGYIWFSAVTLLLGSLLAFIYAFKGFNLGPARKVTKRYFKVFLPVFFILVGVSLVWAALQVHTPKILYFLTSKQQLVESQYKSARIYDRTGVKEISTGDYYWGIYPLERDHYLYTVYRTRFGSQVIRLNLRDPGYQVEQVYRARGNASIRGGLYSYKDAVAFFERKRDNYQRIYYLVVLQPETGAIKHIKVYGHSRVDIYPHVIGADEKQGKRYWLVYFGHYQGWKVVRIWEDGHIDTLATTEIRPVYVKGILINGVKGSLIFSHVTLSGLEEIKRVPLEKRVFINRGGKRNLDHYPEKEIYVGVRGDQVFHWKKIFKLDLETLEPEEIQFLQNSFGFLDYSSTGNWYYTRVEPGKHRFNLILKEVYRVKGGKTELLKEFEPAAYNWSKDIIRVYDNGMVLKRKGKISVFQLPGFEEIEFEKLK